MKTGAIIGIIMGVLLSIVLILGVAAWSIFGGAYNKATKAEVGIEASFKNLENVKSGYTLKIREMAQVPDMYADKLKEVVGGAISQRYGKDGSKAVFQFLQEQNPNLDPSMYKRLQQVMESGRDDFTVAQQQHVDRLASYNLLLKTFPNNIVYQFIGFPKLDLSKFQIIIAGEVKEQFRTGVDEKINLKE